MRALWIILLSGVAFGELPRLTIEHGEQRQNLRLSEVQVTVRVEGDFVDTRMSLNFFNETERNQEGEFRLPLPEGASVNHYALEVNGAMREASVVEKEQARHAYESIKARNVDPGLVEKMEGNMYRTRIFPVLPRQPKRVSIGYVQPLSRVGDELVYRLPFGVAEKIGNFELKIEGDLTGVEPEMSNGSKFEKDERGYFFSSKDLPVEGDLILKRKVKDDEWSGEIAEVDGEFFACISGLVHGEGLAKKTEKPKVVTVVWDASTRGYDRDLKAEIGFLDELAKELGNAVIQLVVVREQAEELGRFQVKDGQWQRMREFIGGIFYDGVADWRTLDFKKLNGQRIILFTSGESSFPLTRFECDKNFYVVQSLPEKPEIVFFQMASDSGGGIIDLTALKPDQALRGIMNPKPSIPEIKGSFDSSFVKNYGGQVCVFVKMKSLEDKRIEINLKHGEEILKPIAVELQESKSGKTLRYLWAQQKLQEMAHRSSFLNHQEKAEIIAHCQKYGLVSDFTSLIVLETMEDHVEYRIPPPEPELLSQYERTIKMLDRNSEIPLQRSKLKDAWDDRAEWHHRRFPWVEVALLPRYMRVKQWTNAQTSVFEKEQLEQTNIAKFLNWKTEAERVMCESEKINSKEKFRDWNLQIEKLLNAGSKLGSEDPKLPEKGEFGVSVRGLVRNPQTLTMKNGATLRQSIEKAGGVHEEGTESRIALYRSGKRIIYNLLSKEYEDIGLLPGDMIVAMPEDYNYADLDPFAAAEQPKRDKGAGPAVVETDIPLEMPMELRDISDVFGMSGRQSAAPDGLNAKPMLQGNLRLPQTEASAEELVKKMLESGDFWSAYKKHRSQMGDHADHFPKVAEQLYKRKETGKARQVLSNLYGHIGFHVPSMRAAAYWMIQFNDFEGALEIFQIIGNTYPEDKQLVLDMMRLYRIAAGSIPDARIREVLPKMADLKFINARKTMIAEMLMMERNRFKVKGFDPINANLLPSREVFPADIRVLVCSSDANLRSYLNVDDPTGVSVKENEITTTGGRLINEEGVGEFMVRRALPGDYRLRVANIYRGACQVEVFVNWGRPNETRQVFTLSGDGREDFLDAGVVKFDFGEQ